MVDRSLIDSSRDYRVSRYFNLVRVVERFYSDGIISDMELEGMRKMRSETLVNYQVAADMLHKMDKGAPEYDKLKELVDYLRKCWVLMDYVTDKSVVVNRDQNREKSLKLHNERLNLNKKEKESLTLGDSAEKKALLAGLKTPEQRREANAAKIAREVAQLPREVKEKAAREIVQELQNMNQQELTMAYRRLLDIERSRVG